MISVAPILFKGDIMPFVALAIAALVIAVDQIIKYFIVTNLKPVGTVNVLGEVFRLTYVENKGVAFGMFNNMRWIFVALTSVMLAAIIIYMFMKRRSDRFFCVCAGFIIGGGAGNLIDRIAHGYVVDYLSLSFFPPVCNFADYCITIAVVVLAVYILFLSKKNKGKKQLEAHDD